jgi:hypothetical protein
LENEINRVGSIVHTCAPRARRREHDIFFQRAFTRKSRPRAACRRTKRPGERSGSADERDRLQWTHVREVALLREAIGPREAEPTKSRIDSRFIETTPPGIAVNHQTESRLNERKMHA